MDYCNFTNKPNSHAFEVETHTRRIHDKNYAILAAMLRNRRYFVQNISFRLRGLECSHGENFHHGYRNIVAKTAISFFLVFSRGFFYKERVARQDLGNLASPVDRAHILNYAGALKISKPFKRTTCLGPLRPRLHWKRMILAEGSSSLHVMAFCIVYISYELIYIPF